MSIHARTSRAATTRWIVAARYPRSGVTQLEIHPQTGRTHQIRVHLSSHGMPIVGDPVYGRGRGRGERLEFRAGFPDDLAELVRVLEERERAGGGA